MFPVTLYVEIIGESQEQGLAYCKELGLPIPPFIGLEFSLEEGGLPFEIKVDKVEIILGDTEVLVWASCRQELPNDEGTNFVQNAKNFFGRTGWKKL